MTSNLIELQYRYQTIIESKKKKRPIIGLHNILLVNNHNLYFYLFIYCVFYGKDFDIDGFFMQKKIKIII